MRFEAGDFVNSALPAAPLLTRSGIRPIVPNITMQADLGSPVNQSATVPVRTDHLVPPSPNRIISNMCIAEPKPRLHSMGNISGMPFTFSLSFWRPRLVPVSLYRD